MHARMDLDRRGTPGTTQAATVASTMSPLAAYGTCRSWSPALWFQESLGQCNVETSEASCACLAPKIARKVVSGLAWRHFSTCGPPCSINDLTELHLWIMPVVPRPALRGCRGLCFHWDRDALQQITSKVTSEEFPHWLSESPSQLTVDGFIDDTMVYLAELADDTRGPALLFQHPDRAASVCIRLGHIEAHPFVQASLAELPEHKSLAHVHRVELDESCDELAPVGSFGDSLFARPAAPLRQAFN